MLYELLVVRLATPWIGSSFTVWSGTMSLILFGLFIGNLLGGWRGDRHRNIKRLARILVGIGVTMIITQVSAKPYSALEVAPSRNEHLASARRSLAFCRAGTHRVLRIGSDTCTPDGHDLPILAESLQ